jgi:RNA polymerase sigma-70 factor (ECF subfamily)
LTGPPRDFILGLVIAKLGVGGSVGDLMVSATGLKDRSLSEDADLIAQIASGDIGDPVAELYRRYGGRLYRLGLQLLGDTGLAEELVQECFVRLWRTAGRFDLSRGTVAAYLFVMGRSIAEDLRKRPSSRPLTPVEDALVPSQPDSTDRIVDALIVRDALDSLSEAHREVLMLVHAEGLTQSQIAERLSLPLGTVKTRMFHGLRALRTALVERGYDG